MSVQIRGFEELIDDIDRLGNRAESISGENEVSMGELFPPDFMHTYTEFESIKEFLEESPWVIDTEEDFKKIPEDKFDDYVDEHTGFSSWEAMLSAAAREWATQQFKA